MVTLRDIAKKVGKSVTTVSRALNDFDDVSPATKELVRKVSQELGYTPNIIAQRLQKRSTDTIGFVIPTYGPRFSDPFFSEFIAGMGNKAAKLGFDILVSTYPIGEEELNSYRNKVQSYKVDGFIIVRTRKNDARINYLRSLNFPFVAFGRVEGDNNFPYVDMDNEHGMRLIAHHLANLGHSKFAFIAAPDHLMFANSRLKGLKSALLEKDIHLDDSMITIGDLTQSGGFKQAELLLDLPTPPTAIVVCNDLMALGAISATQKRGLVVGKDIAIVGFDNIPQAEHNHPSLTTIHQPIYQIGSMVCEMLIQLIKGEPSKESPILLKPTLTIRESCGGCQETLEFKEVPNYIEYYQQDS